MNGTLFALASVLNVVTENNLVYNFFPVTSGSFSFEVKARNDAHISLSAGPEAANSNVEIFFGAWGNTKTEVKKYGELRAETGTPSLLTEHEYRGFWVQWEGGLISMGRRGQKDPFLTWKDPEPYFISYVGISTHWDATGTWKIEDGPEIQTPRNGEYQFQSLPYGFVDFEYRGPHNAHVSLTSAATEVDPMYEIILGGWENTQSVIRHNRERPDRVVAVTEDLWSMNEFRKFRIEWRNGIITASNDNGILLYWKDPKPFTITHFGVRSGWGARGNWRISSHKSSDLSKQLYITTTAEDDQYQLFPVTIDRIQCKIRATNDTHIVLTGGAQESDPVIEVFLGNDGNTKSVIRKNGVEPNEVEVRTPDILSENEFRAFWLSWTSNLLSVGRDGETVPFMHWTKPDSFTPKIIGFRTGLGSTGSWICNVVFLNAESRDLLQGSSDFGWKLSSLADLGQLPADLKLSKFFACDMGITPNQTKIRKIENIEVPDPGFISDTFAFQFNSY